MDVFARVGIVRSLASVHVELNVIELVCLCARARDKRKYYVQQEKPHTTNNMARSDRNTLVLFSFKHKHTIHPASAVARSQKPTADAKHELTLKPAGRQRQSKGSLSDAVSVGSCHCNRAASRPRTLRPSVVARHRMISCAHAHTRTRLHSRTWAAIRFCFNARTLNLSGARGRRINGVGPVRRAIKIGIT